MNLSVGVVVTAHNQAEFLLDAVRSIVMQDRPPDQVVLVDDGSDDGTETLLADVRDLLPDVKIVSRPQPLGVHQTYNDGIRATSTDVVVILNADDRLPPNYLDRTVSRMERDRLAFVTTPLQRFGSDVRVVTLPRPSLKEVGIENVVHVSSPLRREYFELVGGFRDVALEDWDFWIRLLGAGGRGARIDDTHLEYRRHEDGSRNTMSRIGAARVHVEMWWRNRGVLPVTSLLHWVVRSLRRNLAGRRFEA